MVAAMTTETTMTRIQLGAMGEALAVDHLTRMGLRIVERNWRCRYGELDIIARDDATSTVVFVEVKTRTGDGYGGLAQAVTPRKVRPAAQAGRAVAGRPGPALRGDPYRRDRRADRAPPHPRDHPPARDRLMALGRAFSVAVRGVDGQIVEIEADITSGLPGVHLVGLPDAALQESRDRVRAAVTNCGNSWPMARLTLALSPATLPKMGSVYDIALAAAVLSAQRKNPWDRLEKTVLLGELSLDGRVRPVRGVLPAVLAAKRDGWPAVVVPVDNLAEASLVDGIDVWGVRTLGQLQKWLSGSGAPGRQDRREPHRRGARGGSGRRGRADAGAVRGGGGRRRGAPPHAHRPAGGGQNDAGPTPSGVAAATDRMASPWKSRRFTRWPGCCRGTRR